MCGFFSMGKSRDAHIAYLFLCRNQIRMLPFHFNLPDLEGDQSKKKSAQKKARDTLVRKKKT